MIEEKVSKYRCEICDTVYDSADDARACEDRPVSQDYGVKPGDRVLILSGDGTGVYATAESTTVFSRDWGHHAWKHYWHTVGIVANVDTGGCRLLTFDAYELVKGNG